MQAVVPALLDTLAILTRVAGLNALLTLTVQKISHVSTIDVKTHALACAEQMLNVK